MSRTTTSNAGSKRSWRGCLLLAISGASVSCDGSGAAPAGAKGTPQTGSQPAAAAEAPAAVAPAPDPGVSLEVAVVLGAPGGTLSFTLKNHESADLETTPIATNYNRLLITPPDGKLFEHFHWKDGIRPVIVKAHEERSWKLELGPILNLHGLKTAGLYRLRWKVGETESPEILLLKE